jgi:hypothetical protein
MRPPVHPAGRATRTRAMRFLPCCRMSRRANARSQRPPAFPAPQSRGSSINSSTTAPSGSSADGWAKKGWPRTPRRKSGPPTAFQCRTRIWLYRANPVAHGMARTRWPKVLHWTLGPPLTTSAMMAITTIVKGCSTISESSVCDARGRLPRHRDDGHGRAPGSARGRRFRARGSRAAPLFHDRDRDLIQRILELEGAIYVGHNGPGPGRVAPRTRSDLACHIQVNAGWAGI